MFGAFNDGFSLSVVFWSETDASAVDFRYVFNPETGAYEIHKYVPKEDKLEICTASAGLTVGDLVRSICKIPDPVIFFDSVSLMFHPVSPARPRHYNVIIRPSSETVASFFNPLGGKNKN